MNTIIGELGRNPKFIELLKTIEQTQSPVAISGLNDVGEVQIGVGINEFGKKPICIVTYNPTAKAINNFVGLFISFLPFSCILHKTRAKNKITAILANSAGWIERNPKLNQLVAPLTGSVNNTITNSIKTIPYRIGDIFAIAS